MRFRKGFKVYQGNIDVGKKKVGKRKRKRKRKCARAQFIPAVLTPTQTFVSPPTHPGCCSSYYDSSILNPSSRCKPVLPLCAITHPRFDLEKYAPHFVMTPTHALAAAPLH